MSNIRRLSFMHQGDYISYNKKIYKVDWTLDDNNVIEVKNNRPYYINEDERVKWLRNYNCFSLVK